ncbi:hypothetical protein ROHU_018226 [Labeo rohita]|uniref:Uncharacterized protein n=1 Tax=Labeo rohita TaxID=84645 RepID=A0A498N9F2_LABRO|nr:hypothetical protein ROHU_018226 [Labeo rohita]
MRLKSRHVPQISINDDLDDVNGEGSAHFSVQFVLETLLIVTLSLPLFKISLPRAPRQREMTRISGCLVRGEGIIVRLAALLTGISELWASGSSRCHGR